MKDSGYNEMGKFNHLQLKDTQIHEINLELFDYFSPPLPAMKN